MAFGSGTALGSQIGTLAESQTGVFAGAGIGAAFDIFTTFAQANQVKKNFEVFESFQHENARRSYQQLQAARLQEGINAAQSLEDLRIAGDLAVSAGRQSALESGVSGNSINALDATRRIQIDKVRGRIAKRMEMLDADYTAQGQAVYLQTIANIRTAALEMEQDLPSLFEILGGSIAAGLAVNDALGSVGSITTGPPKSVGKFSGAPATAFGPNPGIPDFLPAGPGIPKPPVSGAALTPVFEPFNL